MGHLGLLKARLAKLKRELIEPKGGGGGAGEGFDVAKTGDARVGFVGKYEFNEKLLLISDMNYNALLELFYDNKINEGHMHCFPVISRFFGSSWHYRAVNETML